MKTVFKILIIAFLISCEIQEDKPVIISETAAPKDNFSLEKVINKTEEINTINYPQILEIITDSLRIGNKGENKIVAKVYDKSKESRFRVIDFYSKINDKWVLKNHYQFKVDDPRGLELKVEDFNNDGYLDLSFISGDAARGSNEVRTLMVYSRKQDSLIWIKNSMNYANLIYNDNLKCVDAWMFHGSTSQVFLKIKKDSLVEFASIELDENKFKVYEIKDGKEKLIFEDSSYKYGDFVRFENYNPLIEFKD